MPPIVLAKDGEAARDSTTKHGEYHQDAISLALNPPAAPLSAAYGDGKQTSVGNVVAQGFFSLQGGRGGLAKGSFALSPCHEIWNEDVERPNRALGGRKLADYWGVSSKFSLAAGGNAPHALLPSRQDKDQR